MRQKCCRWGNRHAWLRANAPPPGLVKGYQLDSCTPCTWIESWYTLIMLSDKVMIDTACEVYFPIIYNWVLVQVNVGRFNIHGVFKHGGYLQTSQLHEGDNLRGLTTPHVGALNLTALLGVQWRICVFHYSLALGQNQTRYAEFFSFSSPTSIV